MTVLNDWCFCGLSKKMERRFVDLFASQWTSPGLSASGRMRKRKSEKKFNEMIPSMLTRWGFFWWFWHFSSCVLLTMADQSWVFVYCSLWRHTCKVYYESLKSTSCENDVNETSPMALCFLPPDGTIDRKDFFAPFRFWTIFLSSDNSLYEHWFLNS